MATSNSTRKFDDNEVLFDFKNQAWIVDGVYSRCGHDESTACRCFGKVHAGEVVPADLLEELKGMNQ